MVWIGAEIVCEKAGRSASAYLAAESRGSVCRISHCLSLLLYALGLALPFPPSLCVFALSIALNCASFAPPGKFGTSFCVELSAVDDFGRSGNAFPGFKELEPDGCVCPAASLLRLPNGPSSALDGELGTEGVRLCERRYENMFDIVVVSCRVCRVRDVVGELTGDDALN